MLSLSTDQRCERLAKLLAEPQRHHFVFDGPRCFSLLSLICRALPTLGEATRGELRALAADLAARIAGEDGEVHDLLMVEIHTCGGACCNDAEELVRVEVFPVFRRCEVCGCTDAHACLDGGEPCHWVADDLCSACEEELREESEAETKEFDAIDLDAAVTSLEAD